MTGISSHTELVGRRRSAGTVNPVRNQSPFDDRLASSLVSGLRRACGLPHACAVPATIADIGERKDALAPRHACAWPVPHLLDATGPYPGLTAAAECTGRAPHRINQGPAPARLQSDPEQAGCSTLSGHLSPLLSGCVVSRGRPVRLPVPPAARGLAGTGRPSAGKPNSRSFSRREVQS